jgi:hypothetical protein
MLQNPEGEMIICKLAGRYTSAYLPESMCIKIRYAPNLSLIHCVSAYSRKMRNL